MKHWLLLLLICLTTGMVGAQESVTREQVLTLLEGRHWTVPTERLQQLGPDAAPQLQAIAEDPTLINYLRFRALEALGVLPTDDTATYLETVARSGQRYFARRGLSAFEQGFRDSRPEQVRSLARELAEAPLPEVRVTAGRMLRSLDPPAYRQLLRQESEPWVRQELEQ